MARKCVYTRHTTATATTRRRICSGVVVVVVWGLICWKDDGERKHISQGGDRNLTELDGKLFVGTFTCAFPMETRCEAARRCVSVGETTTKGKHVEGRKRAIRKNKLTIIDLYGYNLVRNFCGWTSFMLWGRAVECAGKKALTSCEDGNRAI